MSTLAIHHLADRDRRELFREMTGQLAAGGVLAIADLVRPASEASTRLAAWQWVEEVRQRSSRSRVDLSGFAAFQAERLNQHALEDPDPIDQLRWLSEAGREAVDLHWFKGGTAFSAPPSL